MFENKVEQAALDFFIINDKLRPFFNDIVIDEDIEFGIYNTAQIKKNGRVIESDHNSSIANFNIKIDKRKPVREEVFNLRNKKCQTAFKEATENNQELLDCFKTDEPFVQQSRKWKKIFNSLIHKCFKKVRIVSKKKIEENKRRIFDKLKERTQLKKELKAVNITEEIREEIEKRIKLIEEEMERDISEENIKHMMDTLRELGGEENSLSGNGRKKMWKLLQKNYPKILSAVPVGKKDKKGNIVTNHEGLKHLYLQTYINRLRNRPVKPEFEEIKDMKMKLFDKRLELSKKRKSDPWTLAHLEKALKYL